VYVFWDTVYMTALHFIELYDSEAQGKVASAFSTSQQLLVIQMGCLWTPMQLQLLPTLLAVYTV